VRDKCGNSGGRGGQVDLPAVCSASEELHHPLVFFMERWSTIGAT
jgi:hypothetical protein